MELSWRWTTKTCWPAVTTVLLKVTLILARDNYEHGLAGMPKDISLGQCNDRLAHRRETNYKRTFGIKNAVKINFSIYS